ncbi:MAG: nitroreductase, partial [Clostridiaceae bacterium]|nr:nitroreductase [Clostridiaceae bacterium]
KLSFYLQHTKGYSKILPYDIQRVDMGIAMCHFELAVNNAGITGKWQILPQQIEKVPDLCEYSISWIMEG